MNCKFCNAEIQDDFKVCPYCGKNLTEEEIPEVVEETAQEEVAVSEETVPEEVISEAVPVEEYFPKKKVWPLVLAIVGAVAALAVLAVVLLNSMGVRLLPKPNNIHKKDVYTVADEDVLVVALNERAEEIPVEPQVLAQFNTIYKAPSGKEYKVDAIVNIPSLSINYPVLSETTYELLKISLTKFWGGEPNSVGNYCIVGHNYDGKDIFFGKLNKIQNGDIVTLQDKTGKIISYKVYNKFIVDPQDVACTSQLTNGRKEMTLITCSESGRTRLVVKCRAEE